VSKSALIALALLTSVAMPAMAQPLPFDMSPESQLRVEPVTPPPVTVPVPEAQPVVVAPPPAVLTRSILPFEQFQLVGEEARRGVNVYLTQAQADAPAVLDIGYINAIVDSPEASSLSVLVNGTSLIAQPIASSAGLSRLEVPVPPGVLRAGGNLIEFDASQRHRTDCSVGSTYELWTQLDPASSVIRFEGAGLERINQLSEIAAIGFDPTGTTTLRFVIPGVSDPAVASMALDLVQDLALALRVPELKVEILDQVPAETPAGTLNVVLATAGNLPASVAVMQGQAASGPIAAFAPEGVAPNTLVVSGPEWGSVVAAARTIREAGNLGDPAMLPQRVDLAFPIPRIGGETTLNLNELGVRTVEFNGRRYRTAFEFSLPADFYAQMYGQAQLVLDAAYSAEVLPGSQFDVYANGQIASATPVLRTDGGLFRNTRIKIPMTNFRPGRNEIEIEVNLLTEADGVCPPGLTQRAPERFLFSNTTQLVIPDFARAAALPDLQAFAGTGGPYSGVGPVPLVLGPGAEVLPAAMTWLARVAVASGASIPVTVVSEAELDPSVNALVVSPQAAMSGALQARSGLAPAGTGGDVGDDSALLNRFNETVGAPSGNVLDTVRVWVADKIGLAPQNLQLLGRSDQPYAPQSSDAVVLAQSVQPEGGVWTYLTVPDEATLLAGVQRLTQTDNWRDIKGRVSALGSKDPAVITVEPASYVVQQTQPFSLTNARLMAANWLSTNVLQFTLLLGAVALVLTLVTAALLRTLGRKL